MFSNDIRFLEIANWDDFLHPDTRRKCKPPFRWIKLNTNNLDTTGDLTLREQGAYCRLLMLAATTNNRIIFDPSFIKRRTGITQVLVEKLLKRDLIRIVSGTKPVEKTEQNQCNSLKTASVPQAVVEHSSILEGRGRDKNRLEERGRERTAPSGIRTNGRQPSFEVMTRSCANAGVSGSDWNGIVNVIENEFHFTLSEKQVNTLQRQLNDRSGK